MQTVNIQLSNGQQKALAKALKAKGYNDMSVNKQLQAFIEDLIDASDPTGGATKATNATVCPIEGCGGNETTDESGFVD